jgi:hypothetical protein
MRALAFVPTHLVVKAFLLLKKSSPTSFKPMIEYFEKYYIGQLKSGSSIMRETPRFEIKLWNCYDRIVADKQRTNNNVEAWHKAFSEDIRSHPTVCELLDKIKDEQQSVEVTIAQLKSGDTHSRRLDTIKFDQKVRKAVLEFQEDDIGNFSDTIALIFATKK